MSEEMVTVNMIVNGENVTKTIPVRTHLVDFVRTELGSVSYTHLTLPTKRIV